MKISTIGRDHRETFGDIEDEYKRITSLYEKGFEEREIPIDDSYYTFISDSDELWNLTQDQLIGIVSHIFEEDIDVLEVVRPPQRRVLEL
jgi:hypothetical protein|tara:strand:+ start:25 stop:294 length:270 start_codon:yes stop_codon:yes gene_type:complete